MRLHALSSYRAQTLLQVFYFFMKYSEAKIKQIYVCTLFKKYKMVYVAIFCDINILGAVDLKQERSHKKTAGQVFL